MTSNDVAAFFEEHGYWQPVQVLSEHEAFQLRQLVERFEREHPDAVGKLDLKATLLFPWLDRLSRHPAIMQTLEPLIGPNVLCHSAAFRNKAPDGRTFVSWHQDTTYERIDPFKVAFWISITPATVTNGCLKVVSGSHRWRQLEHAEANNPDSMLTRGHYICEQFDEASAIDIELSPGQGMAFHYGLVHASAPNYSDDRRMAVFFDYIATTATKAGSRESALLVHGVDEAGNFDHERPPHEEFGAAEIAEHRAAVERLTANTYVGSDRLPEALSGRARNRV